MVDALINRDAQLKAIEEKMRALLEEAAALGQVVRSETGKPTSRSDKSRADFRAPRFEAQWKLSASFQEEFGNIESNTSKQSSDERHERAKKLARHLWENYTNRTDLSEKGGALGNVAHMILCGKSAKKIIEGLQARLDYWNYEMETAGREGGEIGLAKLKHASRYVDMCKKAPKTPTDTNGEFTHNGRASTTIHGVAITRRGGTNRDSQAAEAARLFRVHKEIALSPEILDAVLDNGGTYAPESIAGSPPFLKVVLAVERALRDQQTMEIELDLLKEVHRLLRG